MIKKANINWTAKQLSKMIDKQSINFENAVQRGFVWDFKRKSLLIHSMIIGYPIPAFYASKNDNGYDMLDGKQRCNAIHSYINNEFALQGVPDYEAENGDITKLDGLRFNSLPDDCKDSILDYSFTIYYFDGITEDEVSEMFYRLNNGKALSAFDLMRVRVKDHAKIKLIASHQIFTSALTEKALAANKAEELAMKAWAILYMENPSFMRKELESVLATSDITDEQVNDITKAFDRIYEAYTAMSDETGKEKSQIKQCKKVMKRIMKKTHLISILPFALKSVNENVSVELFTAWLEHFYAGVTDSINANYNNNSLSGSSKSEAIKARSEALASDYQQFTTNPPKLASDFNEEAYHTFCKNHNGKAVNTRDSEHPVDFDFFTEDERKQLYTFCEVEKNANKTEGVIIKAFNRQCEETEEEEARDNKRKSA